MFAQIIEFFINFLLKDYIDLFQYFFLIFLILEKKIILLFDIKDS